MTAKEDAFALHDRSPFAQRASSHGVQNLIAP